MSSRKDYLPKERVFTSLKKREEPDRIPILFSFTTDVTEHLSSLVGKTGYDLGIYLGNDIIYTSGGAETFFHAKIEDGEEFVTNWGVRYKKFGLYIEMIHHPLEKINSKKEIENIINISKPKIEEVNSAQEIIEKYGKDYAIMAKVECTIFESAWHLRGFNQLMIDFYQNKDIVNSIFDITMDYHLEILKGFVKQGVDIITTGDDYGSQIGLLFSPAIYREFLKPRMKYIYDSLRKINPQIIIAHHCCGSCYPIIEDMIEIGLDVLNPIQPKAYNMESWRLKKDFGDRLSFWGGIDEQHVLPLGSIEELEDEIKRNIKDLAPGGGYLIAPAHYVQADTSTEKIFYCYDLIKKYGNYPINI